MRNFQKITFIGDIMCKKEMLKAAARDGGYDFQSCFEGVRALFEESDLVIGNLETPISIIQEDLVSRNIRFNAPLEFAKAVYDCGIHCVSTANNHCLDQGIDGIDSTIQALDEIGFRHTGIFREKEHQNLILGIQGLRIGMLSYTYGTNAYHNRNYLSEENEWRVNLLQKQEIFHPLTRYIYFHRKSMPFFILNKLWSLVHPQYIGKTIGERKQPDQRERVRLREDINKLKSDPMDFSIMCLHCGGQYGDGPTKYTRKVEEMLLDSGMNLIIGNHEHVIQGCDLSRITNNQFVAHCLGNFIGIAGVLQEPYGRGAEFSCACHVYLEKKEIRKISFSILKTIPDRGNGSVAVFPLYDLIQKEGSEERRKALETELFLNAKKFAGEGFHTKEPLREFVLWDRIAAESN